MSCDILRINIIKGTPKHQFKGGNIKIQIFKKKKYKFSTTLWFIHLYSFGGGWAHPAMLGVYSWGSFGKPYGCQGSNLSPCARQCPTHYYCSYPMIGPWFLIFGLYIQWWVQGSQFSVLGEHMRYRVCYVQSKYLSTSSPRFVIFFSFLINKILAFIDLFL